MFDSALLENVVRSRFAEVFKYIFYLLKFSINWIHRSINLILLPVVMINNFSGSEQKSQ